MDTLTPAVTPTVRRHASVVQRQNGGLQNRRRTVRLLPDAPRRNDASRVIRIRQLSGMAVIPSPGRATRSFVFVDKENNSNGSRTRSSSSIGRAGAF